MPRLFKDPRIVFPVGEKVSFWYESGVTDEGTVVGHMGHALIVETGPGMNFTVPYSNLILPREEKKKEPFPEVMPTTVIQLKEWQLSDGKCTYGECSNCQEQLPPTAVRAATMGYVFQYCGWACRLTDARPEQIMQQLRKEAP